MFNDASGIVGFQFAIAAAVSGVFEVGESAAQFVISFFGGAIFGLVVGTMADLLFESLRSLGWETTTSAFSWSYSCRSSCIWVQRRSTSPAFCRSWPRA